MPSCAFEKEWCAAVGKGLQNTGLDYNTVNHNVFEAGLCFHLQVNKSKRTESVSLRSLIDIARFCWDHLCKYQSIVLN